MKKLIAMLMMAVAPLAWPAETPADFSHAIPLTIARPGMVQLRLPRDVYLYARSALLNDVRIYTADGQLVPYALRQPRADEQITHASRAVTVFPLMHNGPASEAPVDLDVRTGADGRLLSVRVQPDRAGAGKQEPRLQALILDLGPPDADGRMPEVDALRFSPPDGAAVYSAQVWLETSNDLKHWEAAGATELNWLTNQDARTLTSDRLDLSPRRFRYGRLSWRSGTPMRFAAIRAELPSRSAAAAPQEQLLLPPAPGADDKELRYSAPVAVAARAVGLRFEENNIVLPVTLGTYNTVGQQRFQPLLSTTFYRIEQDGRERSSGDIAVAPVHAALWALRTQAAVKARPQLSLRWEPATLVFLASSPGPYTLSVGRFNAPAAARGLAEVAPGYKEEELERLPLATAGAAQRRGDAQTNAAADMDSAVQRLAALWGVLLLGVAALAWMVWRLLRQQKPPSDQEDISN
ncbi:DUF3999 family protein [Oxalobacteraceae bacterium A2-2]